MEALGTYEARAEGELSFERGAVIFVVLKNPNERMWKGVYNGNVGLFPRAMVEEADEDQKQVDREAARAQLEAAGQKVTIVRCLVTKPYTSAGAGELSVEQGATVMLPNTVEFESPHSPGVAFYKGVCAGQLGLVPKDVLEESDAPAAPIASGGDDKDEEYIKVAGGAPAPASAGPPWRKAMADKIFTFLKPDAEGLLTGAQLVPPSASTATAIAGMFSPMRLRRLQ